MGRDLVISAELVVEESYRLSLTELCQACCVSVDLVAEMIGEGVAEPIGSGPEDWCFDAVAFRRLSTAVRLQRDLGVNAAGAALALDLLDELEMLRSLCRK